MSIFSEQLAFMIATNQQPNEKLYMELIREEYSEMATGWGKYQNEPSKENLTEVVDGAIDSIYVLAGFLNSLIGTDKAIQCWDEVHRSNMSKCGPEGVKYREDGKILKPSSYFRPDIMGILADMY